ncbi:MAG: pilus assembly protein PilM [Lacunisphaera sp.]|nr:pilus assembly protein PilM [Lacunisphaera sp.]
MLSTRTVILDCGASRTALGIFSRKGHRPRLEDCAVVNFPVTSSSEDTWLENTANALRSLRARVKTVGPVVLVLPAHLALTKFIKTPRVGPAQREKIIRFEAGENIPYALADVVWDSVVAGERAGELVVLLAASKLEAVEPLCAAVQAAGFEPRLVLPTPLATLAAHRLVHPAQIGSSLVLNIGARSTVLLLVESTGFMARTLALGGNSVTQQIAESQDCDPGEAEAIKLAERNAGLTADARETFATRLAQEITRSVLHFRRQSDMAQPDRVHLSGGGARLAGLAEALAAKLKVPVDHLEALGSVEVARGSAPDDVAGPGSTLADLVGAAATQLQPDQPVLNLLPPKWRRQENHRRRQPWLIAAAVLAVAALLPPVFYYRAINSAVRHKIAAIEHEIAPLREREARIRIDLAQLGEFQRQADWLQAVHDRRASWLTLCADLQERLVRVEDVWLERLQVTPQEDGGPARLHLSGRMLDRTNPLAKVSLETTNRVKALLRDIDDSPYVRIAEEGQRFDNSQPGILQFDFELTADPARPL